MLAIDRRHTLELAALLLTTIGHLACHGVAEVRPVFLVLAVGGWGAYGLWTVRSRPDLVREWGFTARNLLPSSALTAAFALASGVGLAALGARAGGIAFPPQLAVVLVLYPLWGWVQQWLVQGVLARGLDRLPRPWSHPAAITGVAAVAFGVVHWPYPALMLATCGLGLVVTPLYLRYRNLWPLGLAHGWLGALLYYWVLGRDPLMEMLSALATR